MDAKLLAIHGQDILVTVAGKPHAFMYLAASPEAPDHAYDGRYGHQRCQQAAMKGSWPHGGVCDVPQATGYATVYPL